MGKFDLKKFLNFGKKNKRNKIDTEEELDDSIDSELDDLDLDEDMDDILDESTSTEIKSSKKPNKKIIIYGGIAASVIALGASIPYLIPSIFAPDQEDIMSNIEPIQTMSSKKTNNSVSPSIKKIQNNNKNITAKNDYIKNKKNLIEKKLTKVDNKKVSIKNIENKKQQLSVVDETKINVKKQIEELKTSDSKIIKNIEKELTNDKLSGKNDILALTDEKVVQARSFNDYLDQKLSNMDKLISYYKKKKELEDILNLYKTGYQNSNNIEIDKKVNDLVSSLKNQISELKSEIKNIRSKEIDRIKKDTIKKEDGGTQAFEDMTASFQNLNIYTKDGRYIAVLQSSRGDRLIREGDIFNGYKVIKISNDMITFEKSGKRYYYSYAPTLDEEYQVAKISLPVNIKDDISKNSKNRVKRVREYKQIDQKEIAQRSVNERLKELKRQVR